MPSVLGLPSTKLTDLAYLYGIGSQSTQFGDGVASRAFDGVDATEATSQNPITNQWLAVDLGASRIITAWRIRQDANNSHYTNWQLQASDDGVRWSPVDSRRATLGTDSGIRFIRRTRARYWRYFIVGDTFNTGYGIGLWALYSPTPHGSPQTFAPVYGLPGVRSALTAGPDLCRGVTTAESGHFSFFVPANAVDGVDSSAWVAPNAVAGHWVSVDLVVPRSPRSFRVLCSDQGAGFTYRLQSSGDATTWLDRSAVFGTGDTGVRAIIAGFGPQRYWRILASAGSGNSAVVYSFSLFA